MVNKYGSVTVIIAAAGSGTRMGGVKKPLLSLCSRPVLLWSIDTFASCECVKKIVISAKDEDLAEIKALVDAENYSKSIAYTRGGDTRQESVLLAFETAEKMGADTDIIAIHDAARPLITKGDFERALALCATHSGSVCASRVRDTLKRTDADCRVTGTVDRNDLWQIQTPQIFDLAKFRKALEVAREDGIFETDDSGLMTHAGFDVVLCETSADNIKITYPEDIFIAEAIMAKRKNEENKK